MRLNNNFKGGWKPITIAMGLMAGTSANLYADVDQFSKVNTVLSNSYITSRYIQDFDNQSEMMMNDRLRFYRHYKQWDEDTFFLSSVSDIINHSDFQAIVAMGEKAVPYIIEEIKATPSPLVWALNYIYQRKITDNPNTTISEACKLWVKALQS